MICHVVNQKILITDAIKHKISESSSFELDDRQICDALVEIYKSDPELFVIEFSEFELIGEEAKSSVIALLKDYAASGKGQLKADADTENVYWLDVWINGNILSRSLKLSDYIRIKIDLEEILKLKGKVSDFVIELKNGMHIQCNDNITIS